jgi:hypothetical protein
MTAASPIFLHHFEKSPFSEKVRVVFGPKNVEWTSVLISRIMPRLLGRFLRHRKAAAKKAA